MTRVEPDRNTSPYPDLTEVEDISDTSTAPYPTLMEGKKLEESDSVRRRSPPTEETKLPEDQDCMEWDGELYIISSQDVALHQCLALLSV